MRLILAFLAFGLPLLASAADQANPAETKLREALRNTALQMRSLQAEKDTVQAEKDALEVEKKALTDKLDTLSKESAAAEAASTKAVAELNTKLNEARGEREDTRAALVKWKAAYEKTAATSEQREAARAKLFSEKVVLDRTVADQRRKNQEMFKIGNEILSRYEGFGLGTAITAREPFVGTMRVKLQNLVQDLGDKLAEQRIKP